LLSVMTHMCSMWSHLLYLRGSCQIWLIQHIPSYNWCKLEILIVMLLWCLSDFFLTMKSSPPLFFPYKMCADNITMYSC
jgi:hypothetical protein